MEKLEHTHNGIQVREYPHPSGFKIAALVPAPKEDPETIAALGATLSRDPGSLRSRVEKLTPTARDRIVARYYRDYGHNSIGEMGNLFLSIEGISMVGAWLAISFARFQGQEASTRYINFEEHDYVLFGQSSDEHSHARSYFELYHEVFDICMTQFISDGMEERDARPKALDLAGGFLPCAAKTSVVLNVDIRNAIEQAWRLQSYFENEEVRLVGEHLLDVINDLCPNSVWYRTPWELQREKVFRDAVDRSSSKRTTVCPQIDTSLFDLEGFERGKEKTLEARFFSNTLLQYGTIRGMFNISFRSARDIWRHRLFSKAYSLVEPVEFAEMYSDILRQLDRPQRKRFDEVLGQLWKNVEWAQEKHELNNDVSNNKNKKDIDIDFLYSLPMGIKLTVELTGDIGQWLYFMKLRSGVKVHPEVREVVIELGHQVAEFLSVETKSLINTTEETDYYERAGDA